MGRELKLVTVAPGVGEREEMMSGAEIASLEDVRVSVGAVGWCAQRLGEGVRVPGLSERRESE